MPPLLLLLLLPFFLQYTTSKRERYRSWNLFSTRNADSMLAWIRTWSTRCTETHISQRQHFRVSSTFDFFFPFWLVAINRSSIPGELRKKKRSKKKIRGGKTSEKAFARTSSPPTRYSWFLPDIRRGAAIVVVVVAPPSLDRFEVDGATLSLSLFFDIYIYRVGKREKWVQRRGK